MINAGAFQKPKAVAEARRMPHQSPMVATASAATTSARVVPGGGAGTGAPRFEAAGAFAAPHAARGTQQHQAPLPKRSTTSFGGVAGRADENNAVVSFLKEAGMEQYAMHLLQSGFDDMETLLSIEDGDMKDLGIPPIHVVRLRRKLQEAQRQGSRTNCQVEASHPVVIFLEEVGLVQYAKPLLQSGFDDMDTLCDIEDSDMKDLGIPRGHAVKLKKRLREFQLQQYSAEEPFQVQVTTSHQKVLQVRTPQRRAGQLTSAAARAMPTEQMKSAVEQSWEQVQILGTYAVGEILYRHTFDIMPDAIQLFPTHVRLKYRDWSSDEHADESNVYESPALRKLFSKFVNAVGCAVAGLHDNSRLVTMLTQLGSRHVNYGVRESHFEALGKAFNLTLGDILGSSFTPEVEGAWAMAYNFMSCIMMEGLRGAVAARDAAIAGRSPLNADEGASNSGSTIGHGVSDSGLPEVSNRDAPVAEGEPPADVAVGVPHM